jgi:hypothetical protein
MYFFSRLLEVGDQHSSKNNHQILFGLETLEIFKHLNFLIKHLNNITLYNLNTI